MHEEEHPESWSSGSAGTGPSSRAPAQPGPEPDLPSRGDADVHAGDVVGGYELLRVLGRGGMGVVWLGRHRVHGHRAAVKLIVRGPGSDFDAAGVPHEFHQVVKLRHEHIVRTFDAGIHGTPTGRLLPFLVMEYLPGARAITVYADEHALGVRERLNLFLDACNAVAYLHAHGDVHLDVKPDNLLVDEAGKVFLADFGIARPVLGWAEGVGGTPEYMGPEQLAGDVDRIDKRADVWALGAVLFRLLAGRDAFGGFRGTLQDRLGAVRHVQHALAAVHPALRSIVARCLDPDRDRRFADAGEVAAAVRAVLWPGGVRGVVDRLRRERPRTFAALVLAAITLGATALAVLLTTPTLTLFGASMEWYARLLPAPRASLASLDRLPDVVVLEFDSATGEALASEGLPGFTPRSGRRAYRALHAAAIPRLVEAGVRVIVFDLFFRPPRTDSVGPDHDPLLALAIREARDHGVPVVLATRDWWLEDGRPDISAPLLDAQALWGGVTVGEHGGHYWTSLVVAREGVEDMPALCLAAYAAFRSPTTFHEYAIEGQDVVVRHYDLAAGRPERVPRGDCRVRGVGVRVFSPTDASHGLVPGDLEAFHVFVLPGPDAWRRSTLRYELLWRADPYELRRALGDKVVVIADPEFDACVEGSDTKAARVHAAAVQSLILRNGTDWAGPWNVVLAGCAAAAASLMTWRARRRLAGRRLAGGALVVGSTLLVGVLLVALGWFVRRATGAWLYPVPAAAAWLLAAAAVLVVHAARRVPWFAWSAR